MKVIFLGGDLRQKYASDYLNSLGVDSKVYQDFNFTKDFLEEIKLTKVIVLPLPASREKKYINIPNKYIEFSEFVEYLDDSTFVLGGNIPTTFYEANYKNIMIDYCQNESFQISNALLSAEGAIHFAKDRISDSIYKSKIAILGFGRIGKILSYLLKAQGAEITIFARKETDRAWGSLIGFDVMKINNDKIDVSLSNDFDFDLVFNTIPNQIIDENFIKLLSTKTVIIDLASYPFGIDRTLVEKYNLNYFQENGIPGRYAPHSAGAIVGKTVFHILKEEGIV